MEDRLSEVEKSLARIEVRAETLEERLGEVLEKQEHTQECLQKALHGNGTPGLSVRVDRLEGWHKRTKAFVIVLFTVVIPTAVAAAADLLGRRP